MHVLPELSALERKFAGQPVTVVGVHSAKFDNEKDARAVRSAVLRCAPNPLMPVHIKHGIGTPPHLQAPYLPTLLCVVICVALVSYKSQR